MINALSSLKQVAEFDRKEMEAKEENRVFGQSQKFAEHDNCRQTTTEDKFTSGKEYLELFRQRIHCFEPFPSGEVIQEFRRWERGLRHRSLITVEEEGGDAWEGNPKIKQSTAEQIDEKQNPVIRLGIQAWEAFEDEKPGVWFGEEAKKGQTCEPTENWFPVDWGQEDKEEEDRNKLFEECKPTKTTKQKWFSRKFLRPKNVSIHYL
ncbi:uncharacterized protein LOC144627409 [Crassostrea virginica]